MKYPASRSRNISILYKIIAAFSEYHASRAGAFSYIYFFAPDAQYRQPVICFFKLTNPPLMNIKTAIFSILPVTAAPLSAVFSVARAKIKLLSVTAASLKAGYSRNRARIKLFLPVLIFPLLIQIPVYGQDQAHTYTDRQLQSLRVPVGGIGSGNILMGGRGNIEFAEVFNRPDRQRKLEKTFFALWLKEPGKQPVAKLLERETFPPYLDVTHKYVAGLPRMQEAVFANHFPHLSWQFTDDHVPLKIQLEIINPLVPLDVEASSYPAIKFGWVLENPTENVIEGSLVLAMENPIRADSLVNEFVSGESWRGISFRPSGENIPVNLRGGFLMGTTAGPVDAQTHWYPGDWRDEAHIFWDDFSDNGRIETKPDRWETTYFNTSYNLSTHRMASLLVPFSLRPGEKISIPFYFSWYFPERVFTANEVFGIGQAAGVTFTNHYGPRFADEHDVLEQFLRSEQQLFENTIAFADALTGSSLPGYLIQALNTTMANLVSPLLQVTDDGQVHGFEGVLDNSWCCPGTCTHVYNYEQTLASLFPSLERKMREIEFLHNTFDDGFQTHRSVIPLGDYYFDGPAAADGQMGTIVRAYREWRLSGDDGWLETIWPGVKLALEFAWTGSGEASLVRVGSRQQAWDPERTGLLSGEQHNTYDIEFYGPNSMTTSIYLAALKAGSRMAEAMGDLQAAAEYLSVFKRGSALMADSLWNGEYFIQAPGPWDETKYQYGNGCLADQLLGQYMAFVAGLGYIADSEKVDKAISAIYEHNFIPNLRDFHNVQRVYGLNDEAGVVLCTWPHGDRPALPFVYSDEIWTGVEFQVAASLIYTGRVEEGLEIVKAVQDRYDGMKRNPFEHIESGVHYSRALAAWSVLLALSGFDYDGSERIMTFAPKINGDSFRSFWSTGTAWGNVIINDSEAIVEVLYGTLKAEKIMIRQTQSGRLTSREFEKGNTIHQGGLIKLDLN